MRSRPTLLALLSLLILASIASADAQSGRGPQRRKPGAQAASAPRHLLWRVQSDDHVLYLLGSIHVLPDDYYPLDSVLERTLDSSQVLALEIALDTSAMLTLQSRMLRDALFTDGQTLRGAISPKTYSRLEERLSELGLAAAMVDRLEPWAVALMVTGLEAGQEGFSGSNGVDMHFAERAQKEGRQIVGLETVDAQIDIFDSMPLTSQETLLEQTLDEGKGGVDQIRSLAKAWRSGDTAKLEKLVLEPLRADSLFYERFLTQRNRAWLPQVESFLKDSRRHLVVVGAGHLIGDDGIVAMLRRKGYKVDQL